MKEIFAKLLSKELDDGNLLIRNEKRQNYKINKVILLTVAECHKSNIFLRTKWDYSFAYKKFDHFPGPTLSSYAPNTHRFR